MAVNRRLARRRYVKADQEPRLFDGDEAVRRRKVPMLGARAYAADRRHLRHPQASEGLSLAGGKPAPAHALHSDLQFPARSG